MGAKRAVEHSEPDFRPLFEDNPQPMWVFDADSLRFLDVNKAAAEKYGYSRDEFLSMWMSDIGPGANSTRVRQLLESPSPALAQSRHRLQSGEFIDVEIAVTRVRYAGHDAVLAVLIDITERKRLEEQLRHAQKMESIGMLAGGIAHDFNNLLTIITGYSQLLLATMRADDPSRAAIEQIQNAGDRAAGLTRQLLAFSRRQVLQPKIIDLNVLVSKMATMLRWLIGEDVDLLMDLGPQLGTVNADPGQMEQVVMNLAVNARDAMPQGGTLTVETRNIDLDETYTSSHLSVRPGPYVLLAVSDNGSGMDAETRSRLFEPFFTTKGQGKGTGLGLSTVFGIVKQSGGNVEVYSERDHGTSVKVYLPRLETAAPVGEAAAAIPSPMGGSETILVVEDDESVRRLVQDTLSRHGYQLITAGSPAEALRILRERPDAIDLLVTDVVMPGMSGRDLANAISGMRPGTRILFMSGYTDKAIVNSGVLDSEKAFLHKPFTPAALARKVREVLETGHDRT